MATVASDPGGNSQPGGGGVDPESASEAGFEGSESPASLSEKERTPATDPSAAVPRSLFLRRVLRRGCPQCGRGALFASYARLAPECSECGLVYRRESGAMTGSMYLSAAVTQVFAALALLGWIWLTDWSGTFFLSLVIPVLLVFCVLFAPVSMALWVVVEYAVDVSNGESWAQPRA